MDEIVKVGCTLTPSSDHSYRIVSATEMVVVFDKVNLTYREYGYEWDILGENECLVKAVVVD